VLTWGGLDCILRFVMPSLAKRILRAAKFGSTFFCLAVFIAVHALAAVPALHKLVHHDAGDPSHQCAVTLLLNGEVHCPGTEVAVTKSTPVLISVAPSRRIVWVSADVRLLPGRGPPSSFFA